ncbi:hypothetical protein NLG97_g2678 [Lecanicillium saksenae]|uniref:Uncharacterized protein n=1 Tax=Lecanicillium saksenae TaxID=468837 RepID=A0ACC1R082_9HYPO|nr:hypothetical protein NLG97_g2678 [Lecanicillium saksenae]
MADWKLLGEVPDSEDEDAFDSQELAPGRDSTTTPIGEIPDTNTHDIWDFPESQNAIEPAQRLPSPNGSLSSSPLSSAQSVDGLPEVTAMLLDGDEDGDTQEPANGGQSAQNSPRIYIELANRAPSIFDDLSRDGPSRKNLNEAAAFQSQDLGIIENAQDLQREAVRLERSLRPRKPIQEHPYLLENAHYSSLIRKHGMRPVQMAMARARAARDENPQDGDFQDDSQGNSLPELNNSSQVLDNNDVDENADLGIFNFPSSSPPKTSPWVSHRRSSNHGSSQGDTDNTSVPDQDLPSLNDLLSKSHPKISPSATKRPKTTYGSSARKRRRHDVVDSDPVDSVTSLSTGKQLAAGPLPPIPRLQLNPPRSVDASPTKTVLTIDNSSSSEEDGNQNEEAQEREGSVSDEPVNERLNYKKRIRGVLPASWLRLDQQASRDKARKDLHTRQRNRTPEKEMRRGVAQTRTISNTVPSTNPTWFFDESEEDEAAPQPATTDDTYHNQSRIVLIPDENSIPVSDDFSDDGSIMEHDTIDTMFNGTTQRRTSSDANELAKPGSSVKKRSSTKNRQQKITASLSAARSHSNGQLKPHRSHTKPTGRSNLKRRATPRPALKPLSVLDVIEPGAPRFLRIAARTAKTRVNQGRTSPSKIVIRLASRVDHVDAMSSLDKWKSGAIPQRREVSEARKERRKQVSRKRPADRTGSQSAAPQNRTQQPKVAASKPRKFVKQTSDGGSARYLPSNNQPHILAPTNVISIDNDEELVPQPEPTQGVRPTQRATADQLRPSRPALLEAEELGKVVPLAFHRSKKFLDRIYRRDNRESSIDTSDSRSELSLDRLSTANLSKIGDEDRVMKTPPQTQQKRHGRPKKSRKPVRIDVDAPQFSHATDPLPTSYTVEIEPQRPQTANPEAKIGGLGPYGTHYTNHFEVFPLDPGVYFHQSTLLGSGIIADCQTHAKRETLLSSCPRVTFQFGTYSCRWGEWNAQTSSELGIVLDLIVEELEKPEGISSSGESAVLEASMFISRYATSALYFENESAIQPFITRVLDVLKSFHSRISGLVFRRTLPERTSQTATRVYDSILILALASLLICTEDNNLMGEKFQLEDLLRTLAGGSMANLLLLGIDRVEAAYMRLQEIANRERGLRENEAAIHSWTLLMQILEISHIPHGSFWDVLKQTIASNDQVSVTDAQIYERIWKTMFTLLPISEFSSSGILMPGKRYQANSDGWMIVQQLLRPVFTVYRENSRQAPSFNNYCRALISRCHYLVQQWGWLRSASIVGAIFDFFGSQNLEHLRNEEINASPRFLEQLAGEPLLSVEAGDKCFHVFLKLLALSIQKLRAAGAIKDIRNLVARTIPNHNRQHLKEQTVHERDLAALRNHHDLLATLFWAAPPDLRPSPGLIERLVAPETSHKEASLINIKCWNQLSRFIVAKGEASTAFKPFHLWRNGFFQKMVQQYDSAASDIQQQLLALPSEVRHTISEEMISSMVSMNKGAVSDVLHASIAASVDVMKHAVDLEAATFCLNTLQLQHIYKQFSIYPPELGWNTLRRAISTLDLFLGCIADFKENEESQQSESQILNSAQADDALLLLDHEISKSYFSMVRCLLSNSSPYEAAAVSENFGGVEQGVGVAVRLAASFINGGLVKLQDLFKRGKYGLFDGPIHKLDFLQRKYLVLVVVTLIKARVDNFSDVDFTLCELWLLVLVKPSSYLKYESQLAESLRQRGECFLPSVDNGLTNSPNYESNLVLFEFTISTMRSSIRDAGPNMKRILTSEHSKALKLVMEQMKDDLKTTSSQPVTHVAYVGFARRIISLIRTHGSEICTLDNFYYQISKDYSPSADDPQLQVAAMVSYGLRLREGDMRVVQQVFFFLFNNFKMALISDSLKEEKKMLRKGMAEDRGITRFVFGKMLPAIIQAAASKAIAYPLLDLYLWAVKNRLRRFTTTYSFTDADLSGLKDVLQSILNGIDGWIMEQAPLTVVKLHTLRSFFAVANLLWPSIYERSLEQNDPPGPWSDVMRLVNTLNQYAISSKDALSQTGFRSSQMRFDEIFAAALLESARNQSTTSADVKGFADNIKQDIDRNWFEVDERISIQTPGKPRGGDGAVQGILHAKWDAARLINGTIAQLTDWLRWKKKMDGGDITREGQMSDAIMF